MNKYRNQPVRVSGYRFASKGEARRWQELKLLERAGEILGLQRQVRFPLQVTPLNSQEAITIGHYTADFCYQNKAGERVVEDFKGMSTPLYRWKKKHFEAQYGLSIVESKKIPKPLNPID